MDVITTGDLKRLSQVRGGHCVTIYMPTHHAAPENQQDPLTLKELLREAERGLVARGLRSGEVESTLAPAVSLLTDGMFWRPQPGSLALFMCQGTLRRYRLPAEFEPRAQVGDRYYLKPLFGVVDRGERFYVLALSQNGIRLLQGDRTTLTDVTPPQMPTDLKDALNNDDFEEGLQFHTGTPARGGRRAAIFHGGGANTGLDTRYLSEFCKRIAAVVRHAVKDREAPLVVAAVEDLFTRYRDVDDFHAVAQEGVLGSPDALGATELHRRAWEIAVRELSRAEQARRIGLAELVGTARTTRRVDEIVRAATEGRVHALFLDLDTAVWGSYDPEAATVETHEERMPGDDDLTDLAAVETLLAGGVLMEATPSTSPLAAILRY